jgi:hypothetical protein
MAELFILVNSRGALGVFSSAEKLASEALRFIPELLGPYVVYLFHDPEPIADPSKGVYVIPYARSAAVAFASADYERCKAFCAMMEPLSLVYEEDPEQWRYPLDVIHGSIFRRYDEDVFDYDDEKREANLKALQELTLEMSSMVAAYTLKAESAEARDLLARYTVPIRVEGVGEQDAAGEAGGEAAADAADDVTPEERDPVDAGAAGVDG